MTNDIRPVHGIGRRAVAAASHEMQDRRAYGPLVDECRARGIGRTVAFALARNGTLETFHLGRRVFVMLDSLDALPQTLAKQAAA